MPGRSSPRIACSDRTCTAVRFACSGSESLVLVAGVRLEVEAEVAVVVAGAVAGAGIGAEDGVLVRLAETESVAVVEAETTM